MGLIINNCNKESVSFASKINLSVDKKEYSINLDNLIISMYQIKSIKLKY